MLEQTTNTTLIFASLPENQTRFKLVNDPDQPGWDEILLLRAEDKPERDEREGDRLFGTRIREAIRVLSRRR